MRSLFLLSVASLNASEHTGNSVTMKEFYRSLSIAATAFEPPRMKKYIHEHVYPHLQKHSFLDRISLEVLHLINTVIRDLEDVEPLEEGFESLQMRRTTTGDTAIERWYAPKGQEVLNTKLDGYTVSGNIDAALVQMLVRRCQVPT